MNIARRSLASAAAAAVLWTSPGLGCFEALAQVKPMAASLPEALALPLSAVETQSFGPGSFDDLCGTISTQLAELAALPTEERRQSYLRLAAASNRSDWSVSAKLLQAVEANPGSRQAVIGHLRSIAARVGARSRALESIESRWTAEDAAKEHFVAAVDPTRLKLVARSGNGKWNAFHGEYDGKPVFLKIDALDDEIEAHSEVSRLSLPPNVAVPKPIAVGRRGLPELPEVANSRGIPPTSANYYAAKGGRVFVMESHAGPTAEDVAHGRARLSAPITHDDAVHLSGAIDIVHDLGRVHGDLREANILVKQAARTHFSLIDWEHSKSATPPSRHEERGIIRNLISKLLKPRGEPQSIAPIAPEPPEAEEPPAWSPVKRGLIIAAVVSGLAFLPSLAVAAPIPHWQLFGPAGWNFAPFAWPKHPILIAGAGAALGWLNLGFSSLIQSLHRWVMKGRNETVERIKRSSPANPLIIGRLGVGAFLEELGFRVMAYDMAAGWIGSVVPAGFVYPLSALAVAFFFARIHRYGGMWTRVVGSLGYSAAYLLTGNIWLPVLMHFFNNYFYLLNNRVVDNPK